MTVNELGRPCGVDRFAFGRGIDRGTRRSGDRARCTQSPVATRERRDLDVTHDFHLASETAKTAHSAHLLAQIQRIGRALRALFDPNLARSAHPEIAAIHAAKKLAMWIDAELEGQRFEVFALRDFDNTVLVDEDDF